MREEEISKKLSQHNTKMPRTGHHQNPKASHSTGEIFSVHGESDPSF